MDNTKTYWVGYEWVVPMWNQGGATDCEITAPDEQSMRLKARERACKEAHVTLSDKCFKIVYFAELS